MTTSPARSRLALGLACFWLCSVHAFAGFTLSTVASFTPQLGLEPFGLAWDAQGRLIGSTVGGNKGGEEQYPRTGFTVNLTTGTIIKNNNPGVSTWLADGKGGYYATEGDSGDGRIFYYNSVDRTTKTMYAFPHGPGPNPAQPVQDLAFDEQGNIIGTTAGSGAYGHGSIYKFNPATKEFTTLVSFDGSAGPLIQGHLVSDGKGYYYGLGVQGPNSSGKLFRVEIATGAVTILREFTGPNGAYPVWQLTPDGKGGLLGTTTYGGTYDSGTIYRVDTTTGEVTTLFSFSGTNGSRPNFLIADGQGGFLGTTGGGTNQATLQGTVFDFNPTTNSITTVGNFVGTFISPGINIPGEKGAHPNWPLIADGLGNFYGTTSRGGTMDFGTVFKISTTAVPEPSSLGLIACGLVAPALAFIRRSYRI